MEAPPCVRVLWHHVSWVRQDEDMVDEPLRVCHAPVYNGGASLVWGGCPHRERDAPAV
jgi:hypothetical protein